MAPYRLSLALARRLRLTPDSAAWMANRRWTSSGTRTTNLPLKALAASG